MLSAEQRPVAITLPLTITFANVQLGQFVPCKLKDKKADVILPCAHEKSVIVAVVPGVSDPDAVAKIGQLQA